MGGGLGEAPRLPREVALRRRTWLPPPSAGSGAVGVSSSSTYDVGEVSSCGRLPAEPACVEREGWGRRGGGTGAPSRP